jgi:hypothetical protein
MSKPEATKAPSEKSIDDMIKWLDAKISAFDFLLETDASPSSEDFADYNMQIAIRERLINEWDAHP